MKVLLVDDGRFFDLEVVGSYGTFEDPIVELDGMEYVASYSFIDPETNEILADYCQSRGCDFCNGDHIGCRNGVYKDFPVVAVI